MRPERNPVPRAREAWWWLGGILTLGILGGGVVAAGIALWENIDIRQLAPALADAPITAPTPRMTARAAVPSSGFNAVLYRSSASEAWFPEATYYASELERWRELLSATGAQIREIVDGEGLETVLPSEVLVVPEAPCVSPEAVRGVQEHVDAGGSLVINWAFASRNEACEWIGWEALMDVTGALDARELAPREGLFMTVPAGLPVSPGLPAGARVELRPDPSLALRMAGERVYWSDWALNPEPDGDVGADVALSTTRRSDGGRVSWFAFRSLQGASPADSTRLDRLLSNGIRWAAGVPQASVSTWPGRAEAAVVFTMDVEGLEAYANAADVATAFDGLAPISFYAVSQLVRDDTELGERLAAVGAVGSQTVDHTPLGGLTRQDQAMRLRRSVAEIERWSGQAPAGLRPPEEMYDSLTLLSWASLGGSYVLAGNQGRSAAPELHDTESGPVVLIPRLVKDDYTVIVRDVTLRSAPLAEAYLAGLEKMRAIGGIGVVAGHTQIIDPGARLDAFRSVAETVSSQDGWWVSRTDEVADWWFARSTVRMDWQPMTEAEMVLGTPVAGMPALVVSKDGEAAIDDVWIDVVAPALSEGAVPVLDGEPVAFVDESWGVSVRVGVLSPEQERRIVFVVPRSGTDAQS